MSQETIISRLSWLVVEITLILVARNSTEKFSLSFFFILISLPREQHCLQDLVFASLLRVMSRSKLPRRVISQTLSHSRETMHRQVGDPGTGTCIC